MTTTGRRGKLTETRRPSPMISSVVSVNKSPRFNSIGPSGNCPIRIFGPGRSAIIATRLSTAAAALRRFPMTVSCQAKSPCDKLSRATFIPAWSICRRTSGDSDAVPIVHTSFVLLGASTSGSPMFGRARTASPFAFAQPVKRFFLFHALSPWRKSTTCRGLHFGVFFIVVESGMA